MSIFKCKMCGGTIEFEQGATVGVCDHCGTKQTLPKTNDDVIANLFNRANNLRLKCEFDKAEQIYERIVQEDDSEAEAHWGIVLCKYGIEYVDDPASGSKIPTCHRTLYESVISDPDYQAAVDYSDALQQSIYESEARAIDRIQKDILAIVKNEKPFDVFLCYKETDENGKRTVDSAIANDIYHQLTQEGFKAFYAAITLEDKLGQAYEPYIFAALHSAKVMLVIGTKPEYFSAVWVRNEWSRYLKLMKTDRSKLLIPCYRDMDAYELPEDFAHLQAQDMSKIGFINDVVRGIKKVAAVPAPKAPAKEPVVNDGSAAVAPLLKRAFMSLEDGEWEKADEFCEQVLNQDPENAEAYLGKLMSELRVRRQEDLPNCEQPFDRSNNYQKVLRFGDEKHEAELRGYITHINERNETARLTGIYNRASEFMNAANSEAAYKAAAETFQTIPGFKDADVLAEQCFEKAKTCIYCGAVNAMDAANSEAAYKAAAKTFQTIPGFKDADSLAKQCLGKAEERRIAAEKAAKKRKKIIAIAAAVLAACVVFLIVLTNVIIPNSRYAAAYSEAEQLLMENDRAGAAMAFAKAGSYQDAKTRTSALWEELTERQAISAGRYHTVGLKSDGTVVAVGSNGGGRCDVSGWTDIVAISAGLGHTVGLKSDGTVVAVGYNGGGRCDVSGWTDIKLPN